MHIPDGFLSAPVWAGGWAVSLVSLSFILRRLKGRLREKMVPLMGIMSAFIFAAQMLNFPVPGGTSGHFLGGVFAAVLLGPFGGALVLIVVLIVQCLVFQDGGITALGVNILNLALVGSFGGYYIYIWIRRRIREAKGILIGAACAAWISVVLSSAFCAVELALSGISPMQVVFPAMVLVHALIGIGEAAITVTALSFILKVRPDLIYSG